MAPAPTQVPGRRGRHAGGDRAARRIDGTMRLRTSTFSSMPRLSVSWVCMSCPPVWSGGGIPFGPPGGGQCKAEGHGWAGQSLRRHRERDVGGARDGVRGLPAGGPKGRSTFGWGDGASGFAWRGVAVPTRQYVVVLGVATRVVPVPLNGAKGYSEVSCALTHLAVRVILSPLEDWYPHARTTSVARPFGKVFRLFGA